MRKQVIKQITINNFQRHKKLTIEFSSLITVIVGESDQGKSTVLRALRWLCLNKPNGEAFIRHGSSHASVHLWTEKCEVLRERGPGLNAYSLNGHRFQAFGRGEIPEEITKELNVCDLNFQGQHDPPFWFTKTPGEVSRELNSIINLDLIDHAQKTITSKIRHARTTNEVIKKRWQSARERSRSLQWTQNAEEDLSQLEKIQLHKNTRAVKIDRLTFILQEIGNLQTQQIPVPSRQEIRTLDQMMEKIQRIGKDKSKLELMLIQIEKMEKEICEVKKLIEGQTNLLKKQRNCPICGKKINS